MTEHLWALFALTLASVLAHLFIPNTPPRGTIRPAPTRPALQRGSVERHRTNDSPHPSAWEKDHSDPDQIAGALVRPYLPPLPRPRTPVGDLLAGPGTDEFGDLTKAIRTYLRVCG